MNNRGGSLRISLAFAFLLMAGPAGAQSLAIGAIPSSHFCIGDPISVTFTATGSWGNRNAFTLQISDPSGSFGGFQNLGSLVDSLPGTFTINTRLPYVVSAHYRFRMQAASPYITSTDNGSDITIGTGAAGFGLLLSPPGGSTGTPITFTTSLTSFDNADLSADLQDTAFWEFGKGATPATVTTVGLTYQNVGFSQNVTYSTTGDKTVTLNIVKPGGCSSYIMTRSIHIFDCSLPVIPRDAIVVNSDTILAIVKSTYWVNPGFSLTVNSSDTVFAESGSTLSGDFSNSVIYMKPGTVLKANGMENSVIFANGTNVQADPYDLFALNCPALDFDYVNAPPNVAHPLSISAELDAQSISLSPNPTVGTVHVQGLPSGNTNVSVFNLLGEMVVVQKDLRTRECTLDLSKLLPGTYYIRVASANSVVTKMVVRE